MSLDVDFQTYLASLTNCPTQENYISEDKADPRCWWQRSNANTDVFLNGNAQINETNYAVEISGYDPDATATIADNVKVSLNGFHGTMINTRVLASFVSEAQDDYIPQGFNADLGFHVFAFSVRILS